MRGLNFLFWNKKFARAEAGEEVRRQTSLTAYAAPLKSRRQRWRLSNNRLLRRKQ